MQADGTRYLIMICRWGCYLMDRTFKVRRLQMRFLHPDKKTRHHLTILDGEMVLPMLPPYCSLISSLLQHIEFNYTVGLAFALSS